jgi:hypothetical protein
LKPNLIHDIETYLADYATLAHERYMLPLALWIVGTFLYLDFDAFPYLVITADTKRSGKTRLSELISFACSNPRNFAAMTGATMFRTIETEKPTIVFDEAEAMSSSAASTMRAVCNVGYRRGQTIPRTVGQTVKYFDTYCPKIFILIGDVNDTLRDRSIIVRMKRAEPRKHFVYTIAQEQGARLRDRITDALKRTGASIRADFESFTGLDFLTDRDEEIWTSLFILCAHFCPERMDAFKMAAVDIATEKTADKRRYVNLLKEEDEANEAEYAERLLNDLCDVMTGSKIGAAPIDRISTEGAIQALRAIPTAPWRGFRGAGLDKRSIADLLSRFNVRPAVLRSAGGRKNSKLFRGYLLKDVSAARTRLGRATTKT